MNNKKISVIVPIYKVEQYLNECVESIVNQTYKNLEILLVDDGSPDNCGKMINEWEKKDSRIKALHKANGGLGDARNYGFAHSLGEYIAFIDSDDYVEKTYLEKLIKVLEKKDADIAGCRFYRNKKDNSGFLYPKGDEKYRFTLSPEKFMECVYNDFGVFCVAWGKIYKRHVIVENMYPKVKIAEDAMVIREVSFRCDRITYIPDALYMYRDREGSIQRSAMVRQLKDQQDRMLWLERDIEFYKKIKNNKLQALAGKAYCFYIYNDWKYFDEECKKYYKSRYYNTLSHMIIHRGNSMGSKCKYMAFGAKILFE